MRNPEIAKKMKKQFKELLTYGFAVTFRNYQHRETGEKGKMQGVTIKDTFEGYLYICMYSGVK